MYKYIDINLYKLLCETSISIKKKTIESLSNHCLQVIRPHPLFLKKYQLLSNNRYFFLIIIYKFLLNFFSFFKNYLLFHSDTKEYNKELRSLVHNYDILVISHLMDERNIFDDKDFYFDKVLTETSSIIFLMNHTRIPIKKFVKSKNLRKKIIIF